MRLFIAIPLPESIKTALVSLQKKFSQEGIQGRYIDPDQFHITLAFIGENKQEKTIRTCLEEHPFPKTELHLDHIGHFKDLIWIGLKKDQALEAYVERLKQSLLDHGILVDPKPFKAHITLIRKASSMPAKKSLDLSFPLDKVILYQSCFTKKGVVYTPLSILDKMA